MKHVVAWFTKLAVTLGAPGLFIIGYLDSSFLSFPEINDLLLIAMVPRPKPFFIYSGRMAPRGSLLGCLTLFFIAKKGGEAFLRKRFKAPPIDGGLKLLQKYGLLVVVVPGRLPPPAPFKIFVLLA